MIEYEVTGRGGADDQPTGSVMCTLYAAGDDAPVLRPTSKFEKAAVGYTMVFPGISADGVAYAMDACQPTPLREWTPPPGWERLARPGEPRR